MGTHWIKASRSRLLLFYLYSSITTQSEYTLLKTLMGMIKDDSRVDMMTSEMDLKMKMCRRSQSRYVQSIR